MYRKWFATVVVLLIALLPAKAQKRWGITPIVGVQVSQIKQGQSGQPLVALKGGAMGRYKLTTGDLGRIHLESGLLFSDKGFAGREGTPINSYKSITLEVPLLLNFDINLTPQVNSFFRVGPYYSHAFTPFESVDRNDYGIQVGIGAEYRSWVVALDEGFGTHDIHTGGQGKAKHINGCLSIGYKF